VIFGLPRARADDGRVAGLPGVLDHAFRAGNEACLVGLDQDRVRDPRRYPVLKPCDTGPTNQRRAIPDAAGSR
jgi:hypothetical protein